MTKKSAMTIAGGLVAALLAGVVALAINLGIMRTAAGDSGPGKLSATPIVQTVVETVKDPAPSDPQAPQTVIVRPANPVAPTASSEHDDEPEHEFGEADDD